MITIACYTTTVLLHRYGALACWDCATAAPHIKVDMNPMIAGPDQALVYKVYMYTFIHIDESKLYSVISNNITLAIAQYCVTSC